MTAMAWCCECETFVVGVAMWRSPFAMSCRARCTSHRRSRWMGRSFRSPVPRFRCRWTRSQFGHFERGCRTGGGRDDTDRTLTLPVSGGATIGQMGLDIEEPAALLAHLRARRAIDSDERPVVEVLAGGISNRTVLVRRSNGQAWVVKQALSKLRVEVDWFSSPERIHRESLGLRWIGRLAPGRTPALVFEDHEHHLVCMEAVPEPHENWKTRLLAGRLDLGHVRSFTSLLARIHGQARGHLAEVSAVFGDRSFFESLRIEP